MDDNLEKRMKDNKANSRRSFLKKTVSFLGAAVMAGYIGAGIGCKSSSSQPPQDKIGNLRGSVHGLLKNIIINEGTVSLPGTSYSGPIKSDGTFEILNIQNPSYYKRIKLTSSQAINRETNITLNPGDNNADINMIEANSGYDYNDYLTVNEGGKKMNSSKKYKAYFYDKTIWEWNNTNQKWNNVGTVPDAYCADFRQKARDVLQNDLPVMSKGEYQYNGLLLESNGDSGPGMPTNGDRKEGWLVIHIRKGINTLLTGSYSSNNIITSAALSIPYFSERAYARRGAFSQDICEWAGYIDLLKKSDYSIFGDSDNGYNFTEHPSSFDKNYIAVIKANRAPGHESYGDTPDYERSGSGNGSGVFVTYSLSPMPTMPNNRDPYDSNVLSLLDPFSDIRRDRREWNRKYNRWLQEDERKTGKGRDIKN